MKSLLTLWKTTLLWILRGRQLPAPHLLKQRAIHDVRKKYPCATFVETGTFMGDTVEVMRTYFSRVYSIELSEEFHAKAKERFRSSANVTLLQGDSGKVLKQVIEAVETPCLFWLDGHYSGDNTAKGEKECPIMEELSIIFSKPGIPHVILIDDARLFVGKNDYPTVAELITFLKDRNLSYSCTVELDIIRLLPKTM